MTALSADRNTPYRQGFKYSYPVAATTTIYAGSIVMLDSSGNAVPASATTGLVPAGVADIQADNSAGAAAAISVDVFTGTFKFGNGDSITKTSIGDTVYAFDDQTVKKTSTGLSALGVCTAVDSDGVWVDIGPGQTVQTTGLLAANNLSDVNSVATSRSNLGLDTGDSPTFVGLTLSGALATSSTIASTNATDSTSTTTGSVKTAGGLGVAKAIFGGSTASIAGATTFSHLLQTKTNTYTVQTPAIDGDCTIVDATDTAVITLPATAAGNKGMKVTLINGAANGAAKIQFTANAADKIVGTVGAVSSTEVAGGVWVNTKATALKGDYTTLQSDGAGLWYIVGGVGVWANA